MTIINEGFNLPEGTDEKIEKLTQFIGSFFLPHFENLAKNAKSKSRDVVVSQYENYNLAKKYRDVGKSLFKVEKKKTKRNFFGDASLIIHTKDGDLPEIHLKISDAYTLSNAGYVNLDDDNDPKVFILVDKDHFYDDFKKSIYDTTETLKHEVRHYLQYTGDENTIIGLSKKKAKSKDGDLHGIVNIRGYNAREKHHMRDIEFKPNVHTYAHYIKQHFNRTIPKSFWLRRFKNLIGKTPVFSGDEIVDTLIDNMGDMREKNESKWRQFVMEVYKEIFV